MLVNLETDETHTGVRAQGVLDEVELGSRVAESFARTSMSRRDRGVTTD